MVFLKKSLKPENTSDIQVMMQFQRNPTIQFKLFLQNVGFQQYVKEVVSYENSQVTKFKKGTFPYSPGYIIYVA